MVRSGRGQVGLGGTSCGVIEDASAVLLRHWPWSWRGRARQAQHHL